MAIDLNSADTILAVDFGTASTRALLFDIVENVYRLVGFGEAPSTVEPPYREASEGLRHALLELEAVTGRGLLDESARLIMPANAEGRGVDVFVATSSAGPAVRAVLVGLLPDVSLASARRTAASSYIQVLDTFSLGDRRGEDQRIDAVLAARPELILIAGGTDDGASEAVLQLLETVSLACHLLPPGQRTRALFMGNQALGLRVTELLGRVATISAGPNVQPQLGVERLGPARAELAKLYEDLRLEQIGGFAELAQWAGGRIAPTAQAAGHFVRFLSKLPTWPRGVLAVDVGSASTAVAAAWNGDLRLQVCPGIGVGIGAEHALREGSLASLARWLPQDVSEAAVREFVLGKAAHPHTVPAQPDDLHLELALARSALRAALRRARPDWPESAPGASPDLLPWFSLILAGGSVVARAPRPGLAALLLLDSLQPCGVTRLMLDPYHLAPALGATAHANPVAVAQVYDSLAFVDLGLAVSLVGRARPGDVICRAKLTPEGGQPIEVDVHAGTLEVLPLPLGQTGKLTLRPHPAWNAGFGTGRGRSITIKGGSLGIIIDGRGRPLALPRAAEERRAAVQQWIAGLEAA